MLSTECIRRVSCDVDVIAGSWHKAAKIQLICRGGGCGERRFAFFAAKAEQRPESKGFPLYGIDTEGVWKPYGELAATAAGAGLAARFGVGVGVEHALLLEGVGDLLGHVALVVLARISLATKVPSSIWPVAIDALALAEEVGEDAARRPPAALAPPSVTEKRTSPPSRTTEPSATRPPRRKRSPGRAGSAASWLGAAEELDAVAHRVADQRRRGGEQDRADHDELDAAALPQAAGHAPPFSDGRRVGRSG